MGPRILIIGILMLFGMGSFAEAQGPLQRMLEKCANGSCLRKVINPQSASVQYSSAQVTQFAVGAHDSDGAVILSIGQPVSNEATADDYTHMHDYLKESPVANSRDLRKEFHQAIWDARKAKDVTLSEYGLLYAASLDPVIMARINATAHATAAVEKDGALNASFDWGALLKALIPVILQWFINQK